MKEYNISEKYKRIYQGILKWKQAGYKGLFQYTERIDIPLVISEVIQHINLQQYESDVEAYVHIVVSNNSIKDALRKYITSSSIIIEDANSFIQLNTKVKSFYIVIRLLCLIVQIVFIMIKILISRK